MTVFAFLMNPLEVVDGDDPIEIIPDYFFQKANVDQVEVLKKTLLNVLIDQHWHNPYEIIYKSEISPPEPIRLGQLDWKYWVICSEKGTYHSIRDTKFGTLEYALMLLKSDLDLGPVFFHQTGSSYLWGSRKFYNYYLESQSGQRPAIKLKREEIQEIGSIYTSLDNFFSKMYTIKIYPNKPDVEDEYSYYQRNYQHIDRAIRYFADLNSLPRYTGLTVIGLFSIIESLIAHKPQQNLHDSLGHQIRTKIPLLGRRFQRTLESEKYFNSTKEETIWKKLYAYRSKIVHDGIEEVSDDKNLQVLKDIRNVTDFLRETVKLLILFALEDPQLITDLKKC